MRRGALELIFALGYVAVSVIYVFTAGENKFWIVPVGVAVLTTVRIFFTNRFFSRSDREWPLANMSSDEFEIARPVPDAISVLVKITEHRRGWSLKSMNAQDGTVRITTGVSPFSFIRRIEINAYPIRGGSRVIISACSPQQLSRGENRRIVEKLGRELMSVRTASVFDQPEADHTS